MLPSELEYKPLKLSCCLELLMKVGVSLMQLARDSWQSCHSHSVGRQKELRTLRLTVRAYGPDLSRQLWTSSDFQAPEKLPTTCQQTYSTALTI